MADVVAIRYEVLGAKTAAAESAAVSKEVAGTGTAATSVGRKSTVASKGVGVLRSGLVALGAAAKTTGLLLGVGLAVETVRSVNAFRDSRKVGKQTAAVIKSTGGAANITAKQVANLAGNLSLKTGVDDEVIQSGANMLLTFKNIRNEVGKNNDIFNQATAVTNDMAAALGTEPRKNAILLGKALNDPIAGLTALTRVGVSFDEQTKENITSLVDQGKTMQAQKIILKELNSEFGGSARANNDAVDRLSVAFENLEEKVGKVLYPILTKGARALTGFLTEMIKGRGEGGKFVTAIGKVGPVISAVRSAVTTAISSVRTFFADLKQGGVDAQKFGEDFRAIGRFIAGVFRFLLPTIKQFFSGLKQAFAGMVKLVEGVVAVVGGILRGDWAHAWSGAKQVLSGAVQAMIGITRTMLSPFRSVFEGIKSIVKSVIDWIEEKIDAVVGKLTDAKNTLESLTPGGIADSVTGGASGTVTGPDPATTDTGGHTDADGGRKPRHLAPNTTPKVNTGGSGHNRRPPIHTHVYLKGREIALAVHDEVQNAAALA